MRPLKQVSKETFDTNVVVNRLFISKKRISSSDIGLIQIHKVTLFGLSRKNLT